MSEGELHLLEPQSIKIKQHNLNKIYFFCNRQQIATLMKASLLTATTPNASQLDDFAQDSNSGGDSEQQRQYQQQLLKQHAEFEHGMMLEREQRVQQIEADVLNVNEIMRDLSVLINEQGEHIGKFAFN